MNNAMLQGPLTRLSLTKGAPRVLSNEERVRMFRVVRAARSTLDRNEHQWSFRETFPRPAPACLTLPERQARGLTPDDAPDWDRFVLRSYLDLSDGF